MSVLVPVRAFILLLSSVLAAALLWRLHLSLATVGLKGISSICMDGMGRGGMGDCTGFITTTLTPAANSYGMWLLSGNALIT